VGTHFSRKSGRLGTVLGLIASAIVLSVAPPNGGAEAQAAQGDPVDTVVLQEDFSSGSVPSTWVDHLGSWQVKDGRLEGVSTSNAQRSRITFGTSLEDYRLDVTVNFLKVASSTRWINLAADFHGAEDYGSVFAVRSGTTAANGLEHAVKTTPTGAYSTVATAASGVALGTGQTHALSLVVRGRVATLSVDGKAYLTASNLFRSGGDLGFIVNNATVAFDDVRVTELAPEATAPTAPTAPRVSQTDTSATLRWSPPADAGLTPGRAPASVTGYEVAANAVGASATGLTWSPASGTSHTFPGLAPGGYTLWVRAVNSEGLRGAPASANVSPGVPKIKGFNPTLYGGAWSAGHVQGIAVDPTKGFVYLSFTTLLVKTDLEGNVVGTVSGFTGHLGDLDFNPEDGRVYGSLEYKAQNTFYIAVIDADAVDRIGIQAQNSPVVQTVYLDEVVEDYTADLDGNGVFDGDTADTRDHRYGSSGIDGVSFGPKFGDTGGEQLLTVAYGVYENLGRTDNDHQVLLQYDISDWGSYERPLVEGVPHTSGPPDTSGKYFVRTGNTRFGVQNLAYDDFLQRWFMGVYAGAKPGFPNYGLYAVDAATDPVESALVGTGDRGLLIPLAEDGLLDPGTGVRGWNQKADVGIEALGDGLFYLVRNGTTDGQQTATLTLHRWTGDVAKPFVPITRESDLHRAPAFTSSAPADAEVGHAYRHTFTASAFPRATYAVTRGSLPAGLVLDGTSGALSGTPTRAGRVVLTVTASNGVAPSASQDATIVVRPAGTGALRTLDRLLAGYTADRSVPARTAGKLRDSLDKALARFERGDARQAVNHLKQLGRRVQREVVNPAVRRDLLTATQRAIDELATGRHHA
jgi:hypothetical protein